MERERAIASYKVSAIHTNRRDSRSEALEGCSDEGLGEGSGECRLTPVPSRMDEGRAEVVYGLLGGKGEGRARRNLAKR